MNMKKKQALYESIAGVDLKYLKEKYATPLFIYDEKMIEENIANFKENFKSKSFETRIIYASKAFTALAMVELIDREGLYLDVVSQGEIYIASRAGMDPKKIYFHGNNKLERELIYALDLGVGSFVIDNYEEYKLLSRLAREKSKRPRCLLRVNPVLDVKTHKYINTVSDDSKFGLRLADRETEDIIKEMWQDENIDFKGLHSHLGSQIFDQNMYFEQVEIMTKYIKKLSLSYGIIIEELNLGGGFGSYYVAGDSQIDFPKFLKNYIEKIEDEIEKKSLEIKIVSIEPGRSIINSSGSTLYTVGAGKEISKEVNYIFVDGGMTDNPRPSMYGAKYEASIVGKSGKDKKYRVAGKCCESGDILIDEIDLPEVERGDLLLVHRTGAYNYSMSSNYNMVEKPAVVFVKDGRERLVLRRQRLEDLIILDEV